MLEVARWPIRKNSSRFRPLADRLAVSRWMIYRLIWDQEVKSVQIGRCRRIIRQSLDDYIAGLSTASLMALRQRGKRTRTEKAVSTRADGRWEGNSSLRLRGTASASQRVRHSERDVFDSS